MVYFAIIEAQFNNNNYNYYNPVDGILEIDRGGIMNVIAKKLKGCKTLVYLLAGVFALWADAAWAADRTISSNYTLTADETVDGILTVESGVTVDLDGHNLTVQGLAGKASRLSVPRQKGRRQ